MSALSRALGLESQQPEGETGFSLIDKMNLSWETRLKGFLLCAGISFLISLSGSIFLFTGGTAVFGVMYTIGTIFSILSTFFLMGPVKQLRGMFDAKRRIATIALICTIIATITMAMLDLTILVIICCVVQFFALAWYSISYIPYAREAVTSCLSGMCGF